MCMHKYIQTYYTAQHLYLGKKKIYVHTTAFIWKVIAGLFVITKYWQQLKCSSVGEHLNCITSKPWNTTQQYSRDELLI